MIGAPHEDLGDLEKAGSAYVLFGAPNGLRAKGSQAWTQDSSGVLGGAETEDQFALSLAAGDFNGDGADDLVLGVQSEDIGGIQNTGGIHVLYGKTDVGPTAAGDQFWHRASVSIAGSAGASAHFGIALAAGDFDADGHDDLAIGAEDVQFNGIGAMQIIYGSSQKLTVSGNALFTAETLGFDAIDFSEFGLSLETGDFNGDRVDDVAIGAASEIVDQIDDAGAVYVVFGSEDDGLISAGALRWDQDSEGIPDGPQDSDRFGQALAAGDFDGDNQYDLAIGVPNEKFGNGAIQNVGALHVLYGFYTGLVVAGAQFWHQDLLDSTDGNEAGDRFGAGIE